ncbi:hypothetical protein [Arthrobacter sp. NA-172]|uniref:hypothetical protein n=1 Tax=Arthrobacter sp. NA-172 TaxID=3367524 RepID=UPI0037545616
MDEQHSPDGEVAGGYGTPTPEQETAGSGDQHPTPHEEDHRSMSGAEESQAGRDGSVAVPSADAELDDSNTETTEPGQPFSSERKGDATGLPEDLSPKDDDEERYDAG